MAMDGDVVKLIHRLRWDVRIDCSQAFERLFCDADTLDTGC